MPKGIKNTKPVNILDRIKERIVPPKASIFPGTESTEFPEGIPLPDGVRVRSESAVEVRFSYGGQRVAESLRGRPTVGFVRAAGAKRDRVVQLISLSKFDDDEYCKEFPASPRFAAAAKETPGDALTVGMALDDWLAASWGGHSHNTKEDYVRLIRNQLKPFRLSKLGLPDSHFVTGAHSGTQPPASSFSQGHQLRLEPGQPAPTSTIPTELVTEDVPLDLDESASGRRKRRMAAWKRCVDKETSLAPTLTKTVTHYKPRHLPLQSLAQLRVAELNDICVSAIRTLLRESGMSVKRVNNVVSPLRQALARLVEVKLLDRNPFDGLKPLSKSEVETPRANGRALAPTDVDDLDDSSVAAADQDGDLALDDARDDDEPDPLEVGEMLAVLGQMDEPMRNHYTFAFYSGLRTGELIGLRLSDIDWERNRVKVRRSVSRRVLKKTKTTKTRWVDLLPPARQALEAQVALLGAPDGWVLPNPVTKARWKNESKLTKRWKAALLKAGVRYRRPYHTRHTYASMMLSAGEPLVYVAKQLGHADWHMVQARYARWMASAHGRQAGAAMAEANHDTWARLRALLAG